MSVKRKYLTDFPSLMEEWATKLNTGKDPARITSGSHQKVWWHCKKCGREWQSTVSNRTNGAGCTCDAMERKSINLRKRLVARDGSLAATRPDIAAEWHPTLNGALTPFDITAKSVYNAWWIDKNNIPWQSRVNVRCSTITGTRIPKDLVVLGYNDLKTIAPELAEEWNYEKNSEISIDTVMPGSKNKVWWICRKRHEWQATITSRYHNKLGCPYCSKEFHTSFPEQAIYYYVKQLFPTAINRFMLDSKTEIDIYIPNLKLAIEYDGSYYHKSSKKLATDRNKNIKLKNHGITLIRVIEEGGAIPDLSEHIIICKRINSLWLLNEAINELIEYLSLKIEIQSNISIDIERDRIAIMEQYILLEKANSVAALTPNLLEEWHYEKNLSINPEFISVRSNKKVWWKCKSCGYEWIAPPSRRAIGNGCPACSGNVVASGVNDLLTLCPELALEWHPLKNNGLSPKDVVLNSNKKVWWLGADCGHEWEATIVNRVKGTGCPYCSGKKVAKENSLEYLFPEIAKSWNYDKNNDTTPSEVLPYSSKVIWWICSKGHEWQTAISCRVQGNDCPYCGNKILLTGYNDFASVQPTLSKEWNYEKNTLKPSEVMAGSNKKVWWICSKGHEWQASIINRVQGKGCPVCINKKIVVGYNDLASKFPLLAMEWDNEKNKPLRPTEVSSGSNKKVGWKCSKCSYKWEAIVWSRAKGRGCPKCAGKIKL